MSDAPDTLVAELTYRCPLRCGYCSNPTTHPAARLATDAWQRVLVEAEALGVLQVHFTGGEPLLRDDLAPLIATARSAGLYTNLITSGVPLDRARLAALVDAGLDHLQLSFQAADARASAAIAGGDFFDHKLDVAAWAHEIGIALTINVVLHRSNIAAIPSLVSLAEELGARRLELANVQFLGSALANRDALLPSPAEIERARADVAAARARLGARMEIAFVLPDYFAGRPRACMAGWARRYLVVSPDGRVLPCQAAHTIAGLPWERVGDRPLATIWRDSPSLARFRGEAWMPEPCRSCDERARDFGGCRCQAFHLTGDAAATDPACARSPHHEIVVAARESAGESSVARRKLALVP